MNRRWGGGGPGRLIPRADPSAGGNRAPARVPGSSATPAPARALFLDSAPGGFMLDYGRSVRACRVGPCARAVGFDPSLRRRAALGYLTVHHAIVLYLHIIVNPSYSLWFWARSGWMRR